MDNRQVRQVMLSADSSCVNVTSSRIELVSHALLHIFPGMHYQRWIKAYMYICNSAYVMKLALQGYFTSLGWKHSK